MRILDTEFFFSLFFLLWFETCHYVWLREKKKTWLFLEIYQKNY